MYFVTNSKNKFSEISTIVPDLKQYELDLPEIQSENIEDVIKHKLIYASHKIKQELIVEDTALELDCLNGLPGPFIKYFEKNIGLDGIYDLCNKYNNFKASAISVIGYYDTEQYLYFIGKISGEIVPPIGDNGFGWDRIFRPSGYDKTFAELQTSIKIDISMRTKALIKFINHLHTIE